MRHVRMPVHMRNTPYLAFGVCQSPPVDPQPQHARQAATEGNPKENEQSMLPPRWVPHGHDVNGCSDASSRKRFGSNSTESFHCITHYIIASSTSSHSESTSACAGRIRVPGRIACGEGLRTLRTERTGEAEGPGVDVGEWVRGCGLRT